MPNLLKEISLEKNYSKFLPIASNFLFETPKTSSVGKIVQILLMQIQTDKRAEKMYQRKGGSNDKKKAILSYETLSGCNIVPFGIRILMRLSDAEGYFT